MTPETFASNLKNTKEFFDRSTRCLTEEHSTYTPKEGLMTVAQQVAHVAQTFDWFMEGAFERADGFDLEFEAHMIPVMKVESLKEARAWLDTSAAKAIETVGSKSMEELMSPLPEGMVMGGAPRLAVIGGIDDHTAHHRGVLTVYSRLLGLVPDMPYMDM